MRKLVALLALCPVVLACDTRRGGTTAPFAAEVGTYALRTVNGKPLPIPLERQTTGISRELIADSIVLSNGGNAREVFYARSFPVAGGDTTVSSTALAGKYTMTRDSLKLPADFPYLYGRYTSGTLTLVDSRGDRWVFTR
ncbi:MAG: hypothetical protein JWL60_1449 [Gemmatimonadetes bacterium]|jgi:hypothetical protein|nr:hypothetical protein [Gemmatimonadota bacterium]